MVQIKKRYHHVFIGMVLIVLLPLSLYTNLPVFNNKNLSSQNGQEVRIRALADTVGFCQTPQEIEAVIRVSEKLERESLKAEEKKFPDAWIAGISPHDDHRYAGRVYVHLFRNLKAKRVILFGVAHGARRWKVENKLIFDNYDYWKGPYGPVRVSPIREELIEALPEQDYLISDKYHDEEHSLEGLIPFLQYYHHESAIIPILIPSMDWEQMDSLARHLAKVLKGLIQKNHWTLGEDIAFVISSDCVHYGDEDWGGQNYADFGVDGQGYQRAIQREHRLIDDHLTGSIEPERLKSFLYQLVEQNDVKTYRIPWCGRYSIPFGLDFLYHLAEGLNLPVFKGTLLRYGTTIESNPLSVEEQGLGFTAPASLRHWVGFTSIGYR